MCSLCRKRGKKKCPHNQFQRSWIVTLCTHEIVYAAKYGYKFDFFEAYVYKNHDFLLRDYISTLASYKIKNSGLPKDFSKTEQETFVSNINTKMKFENALKLEPKDFKNNPEKRLMFKSLITGALGKFLQKKPDPCKTVYVSTGEEIEAILQQNQIINICDLSDNVCELVVQTQNKKKTKPSRKTNCIIGSYVVSFCRIEIHKDIVDLEKNGFLVYMVDTDCIAFAGLNSLQIPLSIGPCFGDFKHEYSSIKSFKAIGRKMYNVTWGETQTLHNTVKMSGLNLNSALNSNSIEPQYFKDCQDETKKLDKHVTQCRRFVKNKRCHEKMINFKVKNGVSFNRKIMTSSPRFESLPFGF